MQEMDSVESALQITETDPRFQFNLDGVPLRLDSNWMCPGCSAS